MFKNSTLYKKSVKGELDIPNPQPLPGRDRPVSYVFVADDAFGLHDNIMKPYSGVQEKGSKKRVFNYRLSRARWVVVNIFGILSAKFRVLRKPLLLQPDKAEKVVLACVYMHNILRKKSQNTYSLKGIFDYEKGQITQGN